MSPPGQPIPLSSPAVLAPPDDRPVVASPAPPAAPARLGGLLSGLRRWESSFALLLISTVYSLIQGATQNIIGIDGYYHIKVALLMREQGWRLLAPLDFPWLQLTILGPGRYTDHHFLFHVLQSPFTLADPRVGAKMAAVLFAVLGLYTTYLFLARFGVRYPLLWTALLIACGPIFLWRQSMARTQSLSVLLIVIGLWVLFTGRLRWLVAVGFLMAWLFNGFFFVIGAPAAAIVVSVGYLVARRWWLRESPTSQPPPHCDGDAETAGRLLPLSTAVGRDVDEVDICAAQRLGGGASPSLRFALTALMWTLVGLGLGLLLHPYFPRNVEFAFFHLLPKAVPAEQASVAVGSEWYPYSLRNFVLKAGPSTLLTLLGLIPVAVTLWRRRWPDGRVLVLAILALGFLSMVAASQRIMEYFPAFAAIFCAWSWSHSPVALDSLTGRFWRRGAGVADPTGPADQSGAPAPGILARLRPALPWLAALILVPFVVMSTLSASQQATQGVPWTAYRDGSLWLARNTPAGSRVFTTGWDDFPHVFYWNTHNTYLVGLDPTYMSLEDPELWELWRSITQGRVPAPARLIRERFDSPYVLTDMEHERFLRVAAADPDLEEVLRTKTVVVFRVRGG